MKTSEESLDHTNMAEDISKEYAELMPVQMDFVSIMTFDTILDISAYIANLMPRLEFQVASKLVLVIRIRHDNGFSFYFKLKR